MTETPPDWSRIPSVDPNENWTPRTCEQVLTALFNAVAAAELTMRKLLVQQADAKLAYERAHVIASTDPECPKPSRSTEVTVAMRDDWIRGMEANELDAYEYSKLNVEIQRRYMDRLGDQISIVQSISKHVAAAYQTAGTGWTR